MAFFDHLHRSRLGSITDIGHVLVRMRNRYFIDLVRRYCPGEAPELLEVGSGLGFFAEECRLNAVAYAAVEANATMAEALSRRGFEVHQHFAPPLALNKQYDVIFMDQVFEHMKSRDQAVEMLLSCRAHLKTAGILIISSPDVFTSKEDFFSDYTHTLPTCMPMLDRMFTDFAFEIVYRQHVSAFIRGLLATRVLAFFVRSCYGLGLFHLLFGKRAHQAKLSLLPSCVVIGRPLESLDRSSPFPEAHAAKV